MGTPQKLAQVSGGGSSSVESEEMTSLQIGDITVYDSARDSGRASTSNSREGKNSQKSRKKSEKKTDDTFSMDAVAASLPTVVPTSMKHPDLYSAVAPPAPPSTTAVSGGGGKRKGHRATDDEKTQSKFQTSSLPISTQNIASDCNADNEAAGKCKTKGKSNEKVEKAIQSQQNSAKEISAGKKDESDSRAGGTTRSTNSGAKQRSKDEVHAKGSKESRSNATTTKDSKAVENQEGKLPAKFRVNRPVSPSVFNQQTAKASVQQQALAAKEKKPRVAPDGSTNGKWEPQRPVLSSEQLDRRRKDKDKAIERRSKGDTKGVYD